MLRVAVVASVGITEFVYDYAKEAFMLSMHADLG